MTLKLPIHLLGDLQAEQYRILRTQIPVLYAVLSINKGIMARLLRHCRSSYQ